MKKILELPLTWFLLAVAFCFWLAWYASDKSKDHWLKKPVYQSKLSRQGDWIEAKLDECLALHAETTAKNELIL